MIWVLVIAAVAVLLLTRSAFRYDNGATALAPLLGAVCLIYALVPATRDFIDWFFIITVGGGCLAFGAWMVYQFTAE